MRKLKLYEHISLDGVIQHSADDDNFPYGDWTTPYRTAVGRDAVLAAWGERYDLLLGRRTYDIWSDYWPTAPSGPLTEGMRVATKFVATHRPESLNWGPHRGVGENLGEEVRQIKAEEGPDLIVSGSSTLTLPLLREGLVDELLLIVYPLVLGTGKRLFAEGMPRSKFQLMTTKVTPTGVVLMTYEPAELVQPRQG